MSVLGACSFPRLTKEALLLTHCSQPKDGEGGTEVLTLEGREP